MTGILIQTGDRPDIAFEDGKLYGGLHCGECFSIFDGSKGWIPVRLELREDWILVANGGRDVFPMPYGSQITL